MPENKQRRATIAHIAELIANIPVAMLTTCGPDHTLRSRPMVNVNQRFEGELSFFTNIDDAKVDEIRGNPQINVSFADIRKEHFLSISGTGTLVDDEKHRELLWTTECERWFSRGLEDEELTLVRVEVTRGEYWDGSQNAMVVVADLFREMTGQERTRRLQHDAVDWQAETGPPGAEGLES